MGATEGPHAFDYLVVADLVSTADPVELVPCSYQNEEVIEISWVVLDVSRQQEADQRQLFVRPQWVPDISASCAERTGLSSETLETADYLEGALQKFDAYLDINFMATGKSFCLVSGDGWSFKGGLRGEAAAKGMKLGPNYDRFFDLSQEFLKRYPDSVGPDASVEQMVSFFNISQEGLRDTGIDKCRVMSSIIQSMLNDGHAFDTPVDLTTSAEAVVEEAEDPLVTALDESEEIDLCVRLRGLPYSATAPDVVAFFETMTIAENGVVICKNPNGRLTGEGFVRFETSADAARALEQHRQRMGYRYIEVFKCSHDDMDAAIKYAHGGAAGAAAAVAAMKIAEDGSSDVGVVKMRGLPFSATEDDIKTFFGDLSMSSIHIVTNASGRSRGEAYVLFGSEEHAQEAMKKHRERMGHRYIELFRSPSHEAPVAATSAAPASSVVPSNSLSAADPVLPQPAYAPSDSDDASVCVRMRGLPFNATDSDIADFFSDLKIVSIHFLKNAVDRKTGEAFVEFPTPEITAEALKSHKGIMGQRYIELFKATTHDRNFALGITSPDDENHQGMMQQNQSRHYAPGPPQQQQQQLYMDPSMVVMQPGGPFCFGVAPANASLPFGDPQRVAMGLSPYQAPALGGPFALGLPPAVWHAQQMPPHDQRMNQTQQGFPPQNRQPVQPQRKAQPVKPASPTQGEPEAADADKPAMDKQPAGQQKMQKGKNRGGKSQQSPQGKSGGSKSKGHRGGGNVLKMRGLPYRTTAGDVLDFFGADHCPHIVKDNIKFGTDRDGRSNGEAHVTFVSAAEAERARNARNKDYLGQRYVELFLTDR